MNISLGEFERRHGIAKGTVSKQARAMGFQTSQGLTPSAYAALADHYGVADQQQQAMGYIVPAADTLTLPQQSGELALGGIGGGQLADFQPEDIERFLSACDGFQQAIDADWERQQQLAKRKAAAAAKVKAKVAEVRQSATLYQARSDAAAMLGQQLDQELAAGMGELGKFTAAAGGDA